MGQIYNFDEDKKKSIIFKDDIELMKCDLTNSSSLNEKKLIQEREKMSLTGGLKTPIDKFNLVYIIFIIHGIGTLMPWNMFMTAKSYYTDYKLNVNITDVNEGMKINEYRAKFLSIAGLSSQIPNLLFNGLNLFLAYYSSSIGVNLSKLISTSIAINFFVLVVTIALVILDTTKWTLNFFYLTIFSLIILNMSNGIYQNSIYGAAAKLPMKFTNAVIFGNNICGTIVSVISIVSLAMTPDPQVSAFYYFLSAILILIVCLISFSILPSNTFYKFYSNNMDQLQSKEKSAQTNPSYFFILRHCGLQCLNVFITFVVTLTLFPTILSEIKSTDDNFFISKKYFTPVFCYLNFNFFAMTGNILPNFFITPKPKYLFVPVFLRSLFIPFFIFCNYNPSLYPVFFNNNWAFIFGVSFMGLTHGYYSSLGMMYSSCSVKTEHAPVAGMLSAFCLICGISVGILMSFLF